MSWKVILEPDGMLSQDFVECFMFDYERFDVEDLVVKEEK